jgi:hypothetical protein
MSVTTASTPARSRPPALASRRRCSDPSAGSSVGRAPHRRARTLFEISLASAMGDHDAAQLSRMLDLDMHLHPKLHNSPVSPGVLRLDFDSGLFLEHGSGAGKWVLVARTWGRPAAKTVREWQLCAAIVAHKLDRNVPLTPAAPTVPHAEMEARPARSGETVTALERPGGAFR